MLLLVFNVVVCFQCCVFVVFNVVCLLFVVNVVFNVVVIVVCFQCCCLKVPDLEFSTLR